MNSFNSLLAALLISCSKFSGLVYSQKDFQIAFQFQNETAVLECVNAGYTDKYVWKRHGLIVPEDTGKYSSKENGRILMVLNTQLEDARDYTCEDADGTILGTVWLAVPQQQFPKHQEFHLTVPRGEKISLQCCFRYREILKEIQTKPISEMRNKKGEIYTNMCAASSATATFYNYFVVTFGPVRVPQPPCVTSLEGLSPNQTFKVIGIAEFDGHPIIYHPEWNELSSDHKRYLEKNLCRHLRWEIRRHPHSDRSWPLFCTLLEVHPITHEAIFQITVYGLHLTSFGVLPNDAGFAEFVRVVFYENNESNVRYYLRSLSTTEENDHAYQIVFIEGVFTKDSIPYTYKEKYSYTNGADFPNLNTSVCSHIENWRSTDSTFSSLSVHCTLYEIDIRNMLIVQLSFYDAQLTSAGISPDPESVAKAVEEWLGRVTPKNRKFEYRSTVIAPYIYTIGKVYKNGQMLTDRDSADQFEPTMKSLVSQFFENTAKYNQPEISCKIVSFDVQEKLLKTEVFQNHKELLQAGVVVQRNYQDIVSKYLSKEIGQYRYDISRLERPFPKNMRFARKIGLENHKSLKFRNVFAKSLRNSDLVDVVELFDSNKSPVIEYDITLLHTEKITRGVPQDPWESGLLCDHILIANTDAYQSEFIPRECDVLDSDLEMSTITFNIRIPRNIVDCYHLDVDDLHVVWKE